MIKPLVLCFLLFYFKYAGSQYQPSWDSLDKRPLPEWYDEAKVGIFLHWGVFSVPSFASEWFWANWKDNSDSVVSFMEKNYPPGFSYQEFAKEFTAEFFNASEWASLFKKSGAKYIVLTSKHHEGYTMWPSKYAYSWNVKDVGPHRDIIGELSKAVRNEDLEFGLYHSLYEWFNPIYLEDKEKNFTTQEFVDNKIIPEMKELLEKYQPSVLWSDGDWEAEDKYWRSTDFLAWVFNESPVKDKVVVNDRWGRDIPCNHGDFYTCQDRYNPGVLQKHKWENAMTIDKVSWGFRRNAKLSDYLTTHELLTTLAMTISCGGNLLMNVGPTKDGIIAPIFEERLLDIGTWLEINGDAIYGSKPWVVQNDTYQPDVWYTQKEPSVYGIILNWPKDNVLVLKDATIALTSNEVPVKMLGEEGKLKWTLNDDGTASIMFPNKATVKSSNAWVIKIN